MSETKYAEFFKEVAGQRKYTPYPYQERLASIGKGKEQKNPCESLLIDIPTGLVKTAAMVMASLWNRVILEWEDWPQWLVYCLPMPTLRGAD